VTGRAASAALLFAGVGVGVLLLALAYTLPAAIVRGSRSPVQARRQLRKFATAAAAGLLTLLVTRWIAAAFGIALLAFCWDRVFGGTRRAKAATLRLEALAGWTESLRDLVTTGIALPEALPASVTSAAPILQPPLQRLADRLAAREPLEASLRALGDDLDDGGADLVVAALLINVRAQGRALEAVLSALAVSLRGEVRVRRTIEAERRSTRRAVQIVVAVTLLTALGLCLGNPAYVQPYRTPAGQLMLAVVAAVFAGGFAWLARLSALPNAPRLLPHQQTSDHRREAKLDVDRSIDLHTAGSLS
jgi:Flp pilus assembly protein TadB